jgi:hypothetical protein
VRLRQGMIAGQLLGNLLDRRRPGRLLLEQFAEEALGLLLLSAAPEAGGGAEPAALRPVAVARLPIVVGQDQFQVSGGQEVTGSRRPVAAHPRQTHLKVNRIKGM